MDPISVKVLNHRDSELIVWEVNIQPGFGPGRLCGAWVDADNDADNLLRDQWILVLPDARDHVPDVRGMKRFDPVGTRQAIVDEFEAMSAINKASLTPAGNPRAPLQPLKVPAPFDAAQLPVKVRGVSEDDPAIVTTIAAAHAVAELAQAWEKLESIRHSRDYLHGDHPDARPFPAREVADTAVVAD
ncbi:hypothetical protein [Gordonia sihwensis]|uniref:hypothetical protein n=1 Tax=Gordonia sihwensis TaxID=173559 RepID=UPI0005F01F57|nr:hypothetical protein [Gordonia sihwensis]KJR10557.1 hypothetical protein UG54_00785 [Gordonia sihwensis]